jgi:hypothetical protein
MTAEGQPWREELARGGTFGDYLNVEWGAERLGIVLQTAQLPVESATLMSALRVSDQDAAGSTKPGARAKIA